MSTARNLLGSGGDSMIANRQNWITMTQGTLDSTESTLGSQSIFYQSLNHYRTR